jgi:KDEL-tailed cysteine endopeptidase
MGRSSPAVVLAAAAILMMVAASSGRIEYGEEDLSSEEALWALYQRWSAVYNVNRQPDEKARRFEIFTQDPRLQQERQRGLHTGSQPLRRHDNRRGQ